MSTKVQFAISDEALAVINRNATERKRGEWLSTAVVEYDRLISGAQPVVSDDGLLERIDSRLAHVERQLALIVQKGGRPTDLTR